LKQRPITGQKEIVKMKSNKFLLSASFVVGILGFSACTTEMANKGAPTVSSTDAADVKAKDAAAAKAKESGSNQGSEEKEKIQSFD
jgi:hypothetical protein